MLNIAAWIVFGMVFAMMVALSVGAIYCLEKPSTSQAAQKSLK